MAPIPLMEPEYGAPARREVAERVLETAAELEHSIRSRDAAAPPPAKAKGGLFSRVVDTLTGGSTKSVEEVLAGLESVVDQPLSAQPKESRRDQKVDSGMDANTLLARQLASGLWEGTGAGPEPVRQARATAMALLELLRQGITSNHALHGAQVKKAVEALLTLASQLSGAPEVAELALGVAWLVAAGPRTRGRIAQAAQPLPGLSPHMGNEAALRQHVDALASR